MKYSEFKAEIEKMGYTHYDGVVSVCIYNSVDEVAEIWKNDTHVISTSRSGFNGLNDLEKGRIFNLCHKLAETPLAEREEEKRYRVKFPAIKRSGNPIYLQRETSSRDRLGIDWSDKSFICDDDNNPDSYLFTEQEIKDIHVLYWEFAEEEVE